MLVRKFLHSCLLVEKGSDRILFDPGKFSFVDGGARPADFQNLKAVIVTHSPPDHMDDEAIRVIMQNNPEAKLLGNAGIAAALKGKELDVEEFGDGERQIGEFHIAAHEARHAAIVSGQIPPNTAYVVDRRLLNPGDSYAYSLDTLRGTEVLALPSMAPWTTELETVGFAARMAAIRVLPIHDGYVKDYFLRMRYDNYENHFGNQGVKFERLEKVGDSVEF
jgi:L-ascorbate metabolism protein UlaG (beta-lactamase superfamily)